MTDENGIYITAEQKEIETCNRRDNRTDIKITENSSGPNKTKYELKKALSLMKDGKSTGPNYMRGQPSLDDQNIGRLTNIFNKIYIV